MMEKEKDASARAVEFAAGFAADKGICRFTRFLDPAQAASAAAVARGHGVAFASWGGYEQAERTIGCFFPRGETVDRDQYPLVCLHSAFSAKFCSLSHRDILGAFMALGLTRDCIGDIIIGDEDVFLFVAQQSSGLVAQSLTSAGKTPLCFHVPEGDVVLPEPRGTAFHAVAASLRLDAVIACAYHLSRSEASEAIRAGGIKLDHIPCDRVDTPVAEGAMLSMRGKGRIRLQRIEGLTRKQRIGLTFFRYE